jgi:hypothetical protein
VSGTRKQPATLAPEKISVARLPLQEAICLVESRKIAFLDRAWAEKDVNVVTIYAINSELRVADFGAYLDWVNYRAKRVYV